MTNENNKLSVRKTQSLKPEIKQLTTEELKEESKIYFNSGLAPSHLKNWEAVFVAKSWAQGLGMHTTLGLRDIFVIDNIPSLRTEAAMALVEISGFCENFEQEFIGKPYDDNFTAVCKVKRKGRKEHISTFSVKDAKIALLWGKKTNTGKPTAWVTYPQRMLMYRAVGFAIRDIFSDVLRGSRLYEEIVDYPQYEIIDDKSNSTEVNVVVGNKKTFNGGNKPINLLNDEPPE
jgi:hypothetical protein